jgi:diguanylate cyclase (GGDEF)-like protein
VSEDLISRYKQSLRLQFQSANLEAKFRELQHQRGQGSSASAFGALLLLSSAFAYLEYHAFGYDVPMPMYGHLLVAALALFNLLVSRFSDGPNLQQTRLVGNGLLAMGTVIGAIYLQKYSAYHAIEFVLLAVWLGSLKAVRMQVSLVLNLMLVNAFIAVMYVTNISEFRILLVAVLLASAVMLATYLGYITERARRMLFLQTEVNASMVNRQEMWASTLIGLDMSLSGVRDFREVIGLLKKHLEPVVEFDSYILTSLEGQGPKPVPDKIGGALFEDDEQTLWSEELLGKLTQTRQATVSAEHETVKGVVGKEKQKFISYRLDIPIFNHSKLLGIISLRRESESFDSLDMISTVSVAAQAMLIFKRPAGPSMRASVPAPQSAAASVSARTPPFDTTDPMIRPRSDVDSSDTSINRDMEMTDGSFIETDPNLVPKEVITQFKKEQASAKKTITLMSRENADMVAIDRYRTAAVEGEPLSVLIIEVDGLSKLREEDGDEVAYKVFAAIVKYIFSKVDKEKELLGRYGQNGLSVLMPRVDMNAAERFAEMIRQFVEKARYRTAYGEKTASLSVGVAAITDDTGDYSTMVKRADMALFVAKKNGRNCVKVRL